MGGYAICQLSGKPSAERTHGVKLPEKHNTPTIYRWWVYFAPSSYRNSGNARINRIDISKALRLHGVKSVLTGASCPELHGPLFQDRPALAQDVVRYAGEPVAMVVAIDEATAERQYD